jgi:hypothetical protein
MRHLIWITALVALTVGVPAANALDPNNCGTPDEPKACGTSSTHSTHKTHTTTKHVVHRPPS